MCWFVWFIVVLVAELKKSSSRRTMTGDESEMEDDVNEECEDDEVQMVESTRGAFGL